MAWSARIMATLLAGAAVRARRDRSSSPTCSASQLARAASSSSPAPPASLLCPPLLSVHSVAKSSRRSSALPPCPNGSAAAPPIVMARMLACSASCAIAVGVSCAFVYVPRTLIRLLFVWGNSVSGISRGALLGAALCECSRNDRRMVVAHVRPPGRRHSASQSVARYGRSCSIDSHRDTLETQFAPACPLRRGCSSQGAIYAITSILSSMRSRLRYHLCDHLCYHRQPPTHV